MLNGVCSEWSDVLSSVVQGSVLGPVLFIVYINDLDLVINNPNTKMFKYADDSKFGRPIRCRADAENLQTTIDNVYHWSQKWGMSIHPMKTQVIHFGHGNPKYKYTLNGSNISEVKSARDLGIIIEEKCSPSDHISTITRKANGVLSRLSRAFICRNKEVTVGLFKTFVRPVLESAAPAWCPCERQDVDTIGRVQRRATRNIPGMGEIPYEERLRLCNLTTLEQRRERGDLIEVYKMMNGFTRVDPDELFSFTSQRHNLSTRSAANKFLVAEKCHLNTRNTDIEGIENSCLFIPKSTFVLDATVLDIDIFQLNIPEN